MTFADQRRAALDRANRVRRTRSRVKRDISSGRLLPDEVLLSEHPLIQTMAVEDVLRAVPGLGADRIRSILARNRIAHDGLVCELTLGQRGALLVELRCYRERSRAWREKLDQGRA